MKMMKITRRAVNKDSGGLQLICLQRVAELYLSSMISEGDQTLMGFLREEIMEHVEYLRETDPSP